MLLPFLHTPIGTHPLGRWLVWPTHPNLPWTFLVMALKVSHPRNPFGPGQIGMVGPPAWLHNKVVWGALKNPDAHDTLQTNYIRNAGGGTQVISTCSQSWGSDVWEFELTFCAEARASKGKMTDIFHIIFVIHGAYSLTRLNLSEAFP